MYSFFFLKIICHIIVEENSYIGSYTIWKFVDYRVPVTIYETISFIYARGRIANPTKINQSNNNAHDDKCQYCTSSHEDGLI